MTLLVVSPDYASHLLPMLALAAPWANAGERVVVATGGAVAPLVEHAGFERAPLTLGRGANAGVARVEDQPRGEDENLRAFFRATRDGMIPTLRLQADLRLNDLLWRPVETARAAIDVARAVDPDAIIVDHLAFGARLGLSAAAIPHADVVVGHPTALPVAGERYGVPESWPAAFSPDPDELAGLRHRGDEVARRFTDGWNRALVELEPSAAEVDDAFRLHGDVVLYNYPAELHDPRRDVGLPRTHAFLGSAVRAEDLDAEAAAWIARDPGRPVVVVSFGSFLSARSDVLARVVAALRATEARVALATGSADRGTLGDLPSTWLVREVIPQVALVRYAALAITHGGNNGVTEALTFGVPVLALPFSTDQFAVAADLERTGVGAAADPNRVGVTELRDLIVALTGEPFRGAAGQLGRRLRADPGPARARSLIAAASTDVSGERAR